MSEEAVDSIECNAEEMISKVQGSRSDAGQTRDRQSFETNRYSLDHIPSE